ncbi:hypothetical protein [Pseudobutyrivibrio sp.]
MSADILSEFEKKKLKQIMKNTSRKVDKVPKLLYHGSPSKNRESILEKGLLPNETFGEIYLCESPENVKSFMNLHGIGSYDIFVVNARNLPKKEFRLSSDHDENYMKCKAFSFYDKIPPNLVKIYEGDKDGE